MTSKTRLEQYNDLQTRLRSLQADLTKNWIDGSLPEGWDHLDAVSPVERHRTKVTMRVDTEMLRWFRKLGPGYQKRLNDVLFIYWRALVLGEVKKHWTEDESIDPMMQGTKAYLEAFEAEIGEG